MWVGPLTCSKVMSENTHKNYIHTHTVFLFTVDFPSFRVVYTIVCTAKVPIRSICVT